MEERSAAAAIRRAGEARRRLAGRPGRRGAGPALSLALAGLACTAATGRAADAAAAPELQLLLAGDTLLTAPWSQDEDPGFRALVAELRAADVAIVNLETVIHDYEGYGQPESGGSWTRSPPVVADELAWAGVDMVSHANNHSFDYGTIGLLTSLAHVERAGIVLAGAGTDLQAARAPRSFGPPGRRVALVSTAATFVAYGRASASRADLHGRPGLNPLRVYPAPSVRLTRASAIRLGRLGEALGFSAGRFWRHRFEVAGIDFGHGDAFSLALRSRPEEADVEGNLAAVREAAGRGDVVVFAIHAHSQGPWLRELAHAVVDAGADVFLAHGPHKVRGVEIYRGRPIFYCLGDFVFQLDPIERHPSEAYEAYGLGPEATPADLEARWAEGPQGVRWAPKTYEGTTARVSVDAAGGATRIELLPLDLRYDAEDAGHGRPRLANAELGQRVISRIGAESERYGTAVRYDAARNVGVVELE